MRQEYASIVVVAMFLLVSSAPAVAALPAGSVHTSSALTMLDDQGQTVPQVTVEGQTHTSVTGATQLVLGAPVGSQPNQVILFFLSAQSDPGFVTVKDDGNNVFFAEQVSGGAPTNCNPESCSTTYLGIFSLTGVTSGGRQVNATWTKAADASGIALVLYNVAQDFVTRSSDGFRFRHAEVYGNTGTFASSDTEPYPAGAAGLFMVLSTDDLSIDALRVNATATAATGQTLESHEGFLSVSSKRVSPAGFAHDNWSWSGTQLYNYIAIDVRAVPSLCPPWIAGSLASCQSGSVDFYGTNGTTTAIFMGTNKYVVRPFDNALQPGTKNVQTNVGIGYQPWDPDYPARAQSSGISLGALDSGGTFIVSAFMRFFAGDSMTATHGAIYCGTDFYDLPGVFEGDWVVKVNFVDTQSWTCELDRPDGSVVFGPVASPACTPNAPFQFCSVQDINAVELDAGPEISWTLYDYITVFDNLPSGGGGPPPTIPPIDNAVSFPTLGSCTIVQFHDPREAPAVAATVLWVWNYGDGTPLNYTPIPSAQHTYSKGGIYDATMTVQDKQGNVATYQLTVDTTTLGCGRVVLAALLPPSLIGLLIAFLIASYVEGKRHPKWKRRLRLAALGTAGALVFVVVLL